MIKEINSNKVKKFWNNIAKDNNYNFIQKGMASRNKLIAQYRDYKEKKHFDKIINLRKNMNVLEVGCGTGRWTFYIAPKIKKIFAIDISKDMIKIAKNKQKKENYNNIEFHCCSAYKFTTNKKFDIIYFSGVLQYIGDKELTLILKKLSNLLSKGGICISRDTISLKQRFELKGDYPVIYRTKEEYIKLFKENKFKLIYNKKSYELPISSYLLMSFFPNLSINIVLDFEKLMRPIKPFENFLKNCFKKISGFIKKNETTHDFFIYIADDNPKGTKKL